MGKATEKKALKKGKASFALIGRAKVTDTQSCGCLQRYNTSISNKKCNTYDLSGESF